MTTAYNPRPRGADLVKDVGAGTEEREALPIPLGLPIHRRMLLFRPSLWMIPDLQIGPKVVPGTTGAQPPRSPYFRHFFGVNFFIFGNFFIQNLKLNPSRYV